MLSCNLKRANLGCLAAGLAPFILVIMSRAALLSVLVVVIGWVPQAISDQTDERLDVLFERLRVAPDAREGQQITAKIWAIWRQTSNEIANTYMGRGFRDMASEHYEDALAAFNKVVETAPDYAEGWNARATLLYVMGDYAGSVADIERTLALEPRHFGAWSGLGLVHMNLENDTAALEAFKKALSFNPHLISSMRNIEIIKKRLEDKII